MRDVGVALELEQVVSMHRHCIKDEVRLGQGERRHYLQGERERRFRLRQGLREVSETLYVLGVRHS